MKSKLKKMLSLLLSGLMLLGQGIQFVSADDDYTKINGTDGYPTIYLSRDIYKANGTTVTDEIATSLSSGDSFAVGVYYAVDDDYDGSFNNGRIRLSYDTSKISPTMTTNRKGEEIQAATAGLVDPTANSKEGVFISSFMKANGLDEESGTLYYVYFTANVDIDVLELASNFKPLSDTQIGSEESGEFYFGEEMPRLEATVKADASFTTVSSEEEIVSGLNLTLTGKDGKTGDSSDVVIVIPENDGKLVEGNNKIYVTYFGRAVELNIEAEVPAYELGDVSITGWTYGDTPNEPEFKVTQAGNDITNEVRDQIKITYDNDVADASTLGAGTHTVNVVLGETTKTAEFEIAKKTITATVATVEEKTYDGTTTAAGTLTVNDLVGEDVVTATGTFEWTNKDAGTSTVNVKDINLEGADSANYKVEEGYELSAVDAGTVIAKAEGTATAEGVKVVASEVTEDKLTYTFDLSEIITLSGNPDPNENDNAGVVIYTATAGEESFVSDIKVEGSTLTFTIEEPQTKGTADKITIGITSTNYTFADAVDLKLTFDLLTEDPDVKLDPEEYSILSGEGLTISTNREEPGDKWAFKFVEEGGKEEDATGTIPTEAGTYDIYGYYYNFEKGVYGKATGKLTVTLYVEDEDGGALSNPNVTVTKDGDSTITTTKNEDGSVVEVRENPDGTTTTTTTITKQTTEGDNNITTTTKTVEESPVVEESTDEDGNSVVTTTEKTTVTETVEEKDSKGNESTTTTVTETVTETTVVTDEEGNTTETKVETVTVTETVEKVEVLDGEDGIATRETSSEMTTTTTTTTDAEGNVVQKIEGSGTETVTNLDADGNVVSVENTETKISGELTNGNGTVSQTSTTVVTDAEGNQSYPVEKQIDTVYENGEIVDVTTYDKEHNEQGYFGTETSMNGSTLEGQYNEDGELIEDAELTVSEEDMLDSLNNGEPFGMKSELDTDTGNSIHVVLPGGITLDINNDGIVLSSEMFSIRFVVKDNSVNNGAKVNGVLDKHSRRGSVIVPVAGDCDVELVSNPKTFTDVDKNDEAIAFVTSREIFVGNGNGTFTPEQNMNRAMVAQILYNFDYNSKPNAARGAEFADVNETDWYAEAIGWAAENNVVEGYGASYGALDNITRQDFITILYRYAKSQGFDVSIKGQDDAAYIKSILGQFTDSDDVGGYAVEPMRWAVVNGVLSIEEGATTIGARDQITRAEVAEIIMNYVQNIY